MVVEFRATGDGDFGGGYDGGADWGDGDDLSLMWQSAPRRARSGSAGSGVSPPVPVVPPVAGAAVMPLDLPGVVSLVDLEAEICCLAGGLAASTGRWLRLVAEFDRRKGWAQVGVKSCAHWLAWACSVAPGAAREYVRVASALTGLPLLDAAFAGGRLSYSKVRAVTRVADRVPEATLLEQALLHTAAQLERLVRGYRKADGVGRGQQRRRRARWFFDEDGMLVLTARLPADEGAVLVAALTQAAAHAAPAVAEATDVQPAGTGSTGTGFPVAGPGPAAAGGWEADAVMGVAHGALAAGAVDSSGDDRHLLVLHADAAVLSGVSDDPVAVCRVEHGPGVDRSTAQRIACDAALVALMNSAVPGEQMRLGRKTRKISPALRRALRIRDGGCRFPGCHRRLHLEAHHIVHWLHGGPTDLDNLILLCRAHHMAVHEDGFTIETDTNPHPGGGDGGAGGGGFVFRTPAGALIPTSPQLPPDPAPLTGEPDDPTAIRPGWRGEPFHLADSVNTFCQAANTP